MKTKLAKILLLTLVCVLAVACLVSCGAEKTYTVTVMDGDTQVATLTVGDGAKLKVDEVKGQFAKSGYEFVGLYSDRELTTAYIGETEIRSDLTLYAKYTAQSFVVSYRKDDGSLEKVNVVQGAAYEIPVPSKTGYTFTGFTYENDDDEVVAFPATGTYSFNYSLRITANWTINEYTVSFYDGTEKVTDKKANYNTTVSLPTATKEGYTFDGWYPQEGEKFTDTTPVVANIDLYARFTANTYRITFDTVGGTAVADYTATYGQAYELTAPTKTGYTFAGYTLDGQAFASEGTYTRTSGARLVANWTINTYDVTFLDGTTILKTEQVAYNGKATAVGAIAGYTVDGYYTTATFEAASEISLTNYPITDDTIIYVKKTVNTYHITVVNYPDANCEVAYGAEYTLPTKEAIETAKAGEWQSFDGYKFGSATGEAFDRTGTYTWTEDIVVYAAYTRDAMYQKSTVTLFDGSRQIGEAFVVDDGSNIAANLVAVNTAKTGYTFVAWYKDAGFGTAFDMANDTIETDTNLYAKYSANQYKISIDENGGNTVEDVDVVYGQAFVLPNVEKRGYTFTGYKYEEAGFVAGTYNIADNITIVAQFTQNKVAVTYIANDETYESKEVNEYVTLADSKPTVDPTKTGYSFLGWAESVDGEKASDGLEITNDHKTFYALFEVNSYSITLIFDEDYNEVYYFDYGTEYSLPETPVKAGYNFVKYQKDEADFARTGTYNFATDIEVTIVWEKDESLFLDKGNYFMERATSNDEYTYVFLTGVTYNFSSSISTTDGTSYISKNNDKSFVAVAPGVFTITITPESGEPYERSAKVVKYVKTLTKGSDYSGVVTNSANNELYQKTTEDYVMDVGMTNFVPELSATDDNNASITLEQANVIVTVVDGAENVVSSSKYTLSGNAINFIDNGMEHYTYTVTIKPKYNAANASAQTFKVKLNTGVNVYTNDQLKTQYADPSVSVINVLRNITAKLAETDYDTTKGGHGYRMETVTLSDGTHEFDTGTPYNDYSHGVYTRTTNNQGDRITVNGNYFSINGSNLPYIDNGHDKYSADGSQYAQGNGYRIANTQVGIFLYRCVQLDKDGDIFRRYHSGQATFNNLHIEGNNYLAADVTQDLGDGKAPLLKMSASFIGIVLRGGTVKMNNLTIENTVMGILMDGDVSGYNKPGMVIGTDSNSNPIYDGTPNQPQEGETQSAQLFVDHSIFRDNWANSVYMFGLCKSTLLDSKLGNSSGAAIHVHDRPYNVSNSVSELGYSNLDAELYLDMYTAANINNWISGEEAWFVAYNFSVPALNAKTSINQWVADVTTHLWADEDHATYTILDNTQQKMNFAILCGETGASGWAVDERNEDNHKGAYLKLQVAQRHIADASTAFGTPTPALDFNYFYQYKESDYPELATIEDASIALNGTPFVTPPAAMAAGMIIYVPAYRIG